MQSSQVGSIVIFENDPFHFEIHIVSNSSNSITSEMQVTAVRQLDGVTLVSQWNVIELMKTMCLLFKSVPLLVS